MEQRCQVMVTVLSPPHDPQKKVDLQRIQGPDCHPNCLVPNCLHLHGGWASILIPDGPSSSEENASLVAMAPAEGVSAAITSTIHTFDGEKSLMALP